MERKGGRSLQYNDLIFWSGPQGIILYKTPRYSWETTLNFAHWKTDM